VERETSLLRELISLLLHLKEQEGQSLQLQGSFLLKPSQKGQEETSFGRRLLEGKGERLRGEKKGRSSKTKVTGVRKNIYLG